MVVVVLVQKWLALDHQHVDHDFGHLYDDRSYYNTATQNIAMITVIMLYFIVVIVSPAVIIVITVSHFIIMISVAASTDISSCMLFCIVLFHLILCVMMIATAFHDCIPLRRSCAFAFSKAARQ